MKVIIFDMDGTILDSSKAIEVTINSIRKEMGLEPLSRDFIVRVINEPGRNLLYDLYGINSVNRSLKEGFEDKFKINYDLYARAFEGICELLKKCKEAGYTVALASNAPAKTLEDILKRNEIFEYFDIVVGADEKIPQKPDPTMLEVVCEMAKNKRAVFIGDSLKDEGAAVNAKMPYIHVNWGFGTKEDAKSYVADTTDEVWNIIERFI